MNHDAFLTEYEEALDAAFGERVLFIGLQGSRARGEHRDDSDYDVVVILNELTPGDIETYHRMVLGLTHAELACGFLAGCADLMAWDPADLFSLCADTVPVRGTLQEAWARLDKEAYHAAAWAGVCAVFHGCVHNMIYERSNKILRGLIKQATFAIRACQSVRTGVIPRTVPDMLKDASNQETPVLNMFTAVRNGEEMSFGHASGVLFEWAQSAVLELGKDHAGVSQ